MKAKKIQERMIKILCMVLLITILISLVLSLKYVDNKVYATIVHSSLLILWILILIIPKNIFNMIQSMLNEGKNREIYKFEIWIYRVMAVFWMLSTLFYIRYLWIYRG